LKDAVIKISEDKEIRSIIDDAIKQTVDEHFIKKRINPPSYVPNSSVFTLFDNTVGTFEIEIEFLDNIQEDIDIIDSIECWSGEICNIIVSNFYKETILPLIKKIVKMDSSKRSLEKIGSYYGFPNVSERRGRLKCDFRKTEVGMPLWVNRSIITENSENIRKEFFYKWILSEENKEDVYESICGNVKEDRCVYLGWGNNFIHSKNKNGVEEDVKKSLILAQYYYTILDNLGLNLTYIISAAKKLKRSKDHKAYNVLFKELVATVNIIEIRFIDTRQRLQGNRRYFFKDLVNKWDFDELIISLNKKKVVCEKLVTDLYHQSFKKGQIMAELLLFFLAGISLLEFANTLVSYWSDNAGMNDHIPGIYDIGKLVPPDLLLWGAFFILSLFFILYFKLYINRKS